MYASELKKKYGKSLIGLCIYTQAIGEYPGGWATVVDIDHDPAALRIITLDMVSDIIDRICKQNGWGNQEVISSYRAKGLDGRYLTAVKFKAFCGNVNIEMSLSFDGHELECDVDL